MPENYKLTYFSLTAVGEPIRFIFAYAGVKYEDNRIELQDWSPATKKNYPWGQLPVLEVNGKTLAQANTIMRYLGRKHNLYGSDDWENAKIDELADYIADFRNEFTPVRVEENPAKKKQMVTNFLSNVVPKYYGRLNTEWGKNEQGPYLFGKTVTWADLMIASYIFIIDGFFPGTSEPYRNLKKVQSTVFEMPKIKEWIEKRPKTLF